MRHSCSVDADLGTGAELEDADDAFLVARAVGGDLRAFTTLLRRYNRTLRSYVERLTRNAADTDDVLQDAAVSAWKNLDSVRDPTRVRAWLIQVATREALRHLRDRRDTAELTDESIEVPGPETDVGYLDLRRELRAALDALPERQAQSWILRELGGYSYTEIAAELDIPESTVRGSLAQARKTILRTMGGPR